MATKEEVIENALNYFSTGRHASFSMRAFMDSYQGDDGKWWVDPFDPRMVALLKLPRTQRVLYDGRFPITTFSSRVYGNTSLWMLVLLCSGYIHPHQIPANSYIRLPTVERVAALLNNSSESKGLQGQTITI